MIIKVLSVTVSVLLALLPAASGMTADKAESLIFNGTDLSPGIHETPVGYMLTSDIIGLIHEAGYNINITLGSNNKWALVYDVSQLPKVAVIYDRIFSKGKNTGIIAQVMYFGAGSFFALEINGGWHYTGVVKDGNSISVVEFNTIKIYPLHFKYSVPLTSYPFLTSSPADLNSTYNA
jgi:hypothetical protein